MRVSVKRSHVVSGGHPAIPGHFPGFPVVPAVMILEIVLGDLSAAPGSPVATGLRHAKFLSVLKPDETFEVEIESGDDGAFLFSCRKAEGDRFAFGELIAGDSTNA